MNATLTRPDSLRAASKSVAPSDTFALTFLDDELQAELAQLAAINEELLAGHAFVATPSESPRQGPAEEGANELTSLRLDNAVLRARVIDLEIQLQGAPAANAEAAGRREFEAVLEEKSEVIRALHKKIEDLQGGKSSPSGEIEHAFREMEEDRKRFKEDENSLQQQAREMETTLARERAEIARQRADLQRLQADLTREIENAARDPQLRERLQNLQRRPGSRVELPRPVIEQPAAKTPEPTPPRKNNSGLFRRLFGGANA